MTQKDSNNDKILTTDDSGVLISIEDYAKLHGDPNNSTASERNYFDSNKKIESENIFQKISQMPNSQPKKAKQPLKIECRYCKKIVKKNKINEHNSLYHPDKLPASHKQDRNSLLPKHKKKHDGDVDIEPEGKLGNIAEAFKQAFNEIRYGAKGMHHRHEWDGKFGSTPLHDDYDDESDSE